MPDRSFVYRALALLIPCIAYRLLSSHWPEVVPNISPLVAVALVGAMYLPRTWGWLVGPVAMLVTDAAFLSANLRTEGSMFSWWTLFSLVFYALAGGLGVLLARNKSLLKIAGGSILCSVVFYVIANTFAWWGNSSPLVTPSYMPTFSGWWQANTVGLPGWQPTWTFLRNGVLGDLAFTFALVFAFEPRLFANPFRPRKGTQEIMRMMLEVQNGTEQSRNKPILISRLCTWKTRK